MTAPYLETLYLLRQAHRRLIDVVKDGLDRAGVSNVTAAEALLLHSVASTVLETGRLRTDGHYHGTNVSYCVKKLVASDLIERKRSEVDGRKVYNALTDKGRKIRDLVEALFAHHARTLAKVADVNLDELGAINRSLKRLDQFWIDQIRYRL